MKDPLTPGGTVSDYCVLDYGAAGDGKENDTCAIQRAIDLCAENGGGRVRIPGGYTFRSGSLVLRSFVELHLEAGAVLKASDALADFCLFGGMDTVGNGDGRPSYANSDYSGKPVFYFLYAKGCQNVSITGRGCIDGNESIFYGTVTRWHIDGAFYPRMPLLYLEDVSNLTLHEVTLQNSAFWTVHMVGCRDVLINSIRIRNNLRMGSSDGIDPDHCSRVRVIDCDIECADDCIVLKNTASAVQYGPCEDVVIENCSLKSTSAALKIGTESEGLFRNIRVENCTVTGTNRGISLQLRDSGSIENVLFRNITIETRRFSPEHWWGSGEPVAVTALPRKNDTKLGCIRDVTFENIRCSGENGILLYGASSEHIQNIVFHDVTLEMCKKTDWPRYEHDLRPTCGCEKVKDAPYFVYAKGASQVQFEQLQTGAQGVEMPDVLFTEDCPNLQIMEQEKGTTVAEV